MNSPEKKMERNKLFCEIDNKKFGLFNLEHVCKRCLRNMCGDCTRKSLVICID